MTGQFSSLKMVWLCQKVKHDRHPLNYKVNKIKWSPENIPCEQVMWPKQLYGINLYAVCYYCYGELKTSLKMENLASLRISV